MVLSVEAQSASFPGSVVRVRALFLRTSSRAFLAASEARAAAMALPMTAFSTPGSMARASCTSCSSPPASGRWQRKQALMQCWDADSGGAGSMTAEALGS